MGGDGDPSADGDQAFSSDVFRLRLGQHPTAPGRARRSIGDWLVSVGCPTEVVEAMAVVTSELVTNAIIHADSAPEVTVTLSDGRVRLEVHDTHPAAPVIRPDDDRRVGGFGLRVVEALTDGWGWEPTSGGKRVWVETLF
ncbi:MAG: ATP-binding protein [Ilumatobacteraceae bacterium]